MNQDYAMQKVLFGLEDIAESYLAGKQCVEELRELSGQIETQICRAAVTGEFKKGKTSLVNALLGARILPMDVLPGTAVVNRISYGETESVRVQFRDGSEKQIPVQTLAEYGSLREPEKELIAETVTQIHVEYPSVFCRNNIELVDVPGLDDRANMTEATLGVLGRIDAAIMVVSAAMHMSAAEEDLILRLLGDPQIHHIIFAVTFIDRVEERVRRQVIDRIRSSLSGGLLERLRTESPEDEGLLKKARRILEEPAVLPVSPATALQGFVTDSSSLVRESGLPEFKYRLTALLTATQTRMVRERTRAAAEKMAEQIDAWHQVDMDAIRGEHAALSELLRTSRTYLTGSAELLIGEFQRTDLELKANGFMPETGFTGSPCASAIRRCFIRELSTIKAGQYSSDNIARALGWAKACAPEVAEKELSGLRDRMDRICLRHEAEFLWHREQGFLNPVERLKELLSWAMEPGIYSRVESLLSRHTRERGMVSRAFIWHGELFAPGTNLENMDIMPIVNERIRQEMNALYDAYAAYLAQWRKKLLEQNRADREALELLEQLCEDRCGYLEFRCRACEAQHEKNREKLEKLTAVFL